MFEDSGINASVKRVKNTLNYSLYKKYGIVNDDITEKILKMHGLSKDNFDFINNIELLTNSNLADTSLDTNANKSGKTLAGLQYESSIPLYKMVGYRALYRKIKDLYGKKEAKKLTGEMYDMSLAIHDSGKLLLPYCWAFDASKIVIQGVPFGQLKSNPPHRVSSYIDSLKEIIHQMSSQLAGAIAIGTFFFDICHVLYYREKVTLEQLQESKELQKYIINCYQTFVHSVNNPMSRNNIESPFTNISLFDREKLKNLLAKDNMGWYFEKIDINYIIEYIIYLEKLYMDFFDKGDPLSNGKPYTFPVSTVNLSRKNINGVIDVVDKDFEKEYCKHDVYRYHTYVSEGNKISSCCFDEDTKVLIYSTNGVEEKKLKEVYEMPKNGINLRIFHNGNWLFGNPIKVNRENKKMYKIITSNKKEMIVTEDHIFLTLEKDKKVCELTEDDYLLFNNNLLNESTPGRYNKKSILTYEQGILIGSYLGDGSSYKNKDNNGTIICFSLNLKKDKELIPIFEIALKQLGINKNIYKNELKNNCYNVCIHDINLYNFIKYWVYGNYSYEKELNLECLLESKDFRKGILKGLYLTDGGNSNRIYSSSKKLISNMETLLTSLGKVSCIDCVDRTNEKVFIRDNFYNRNYPSYSIRWYDRKSKRKQENVYIFRNGNIYFKINSIEEIKEYNKESVYCFEMRNKEEPYFTLPNGVITHNCRLLSDADMFNLGGLSNSFGGSAISLGSHRVVLINFNRIALEATDYDSFFKILSERIDDATKILYSHRKMLQDTIDKGMQPLMTLGWIQLKKMFSTYGIIGLTETKETMLKKFGDFNKDLIEESLKLLNDKASYWTNELKTPFNIEQVPGETMAIRLTQIDKLIYGESCVPYELYSNQFIPLWEDKSIWERMEIDGKYQKLYTGGSICFFNLGEKTTTTQNKKIIDYAIKSGCELFALNSVYSECVDGHSSFGKQKICPICGKEITDYLTRVVGFYTKISGWNITRRNWEFPRRQFKAID